MIGISVDVSEMAKILRELAAWQPSAILQKAKELSFDPKQAYPYFFVYLSRVGLQRDSGVMDSINFLLDHCSTKRTVKSDELILGGKAERDGDAIVLTNNDNQWSDAIINFEIGERLVWGIRYVATLKTGTEIKLEMADLVFAINTEDHPSPQKTKIFRWDQARNDFADVVQTSNLVARRDYPLLINLFLWDRSVWYTADDKVVFAHKLNALDRENWRTSKPRFITWNSRARIQRITLFDFQ